MIKYQKNMSDISPRKPSNPRRISSFKFRNSCRQQSREPPRKIVEPFIYQSGTSEGMTDTLTDRMSSDAFFSIDKVTIERHDAYGTPIKKGRKDHKVSFIDNVQKAPIAVVSEIASEKKSFPVKYKICYQTRRQNSIDLFKMKQENSNNSSSGRGNNSANNMTDKEAVKCQACCIF